MVPLAFSPPGVSITHILGGTRWLSLNGKINDLAQCISLDLICCYNNRKRAFQSFCGVHWATEPHFRFCHTSLYLRGSVNHSGLEICFLFSPLGDTKFGKFSKTVFLGYCQSALQTAINEGMENMIFRASYLRVAILGTPYFWNSPVKDCYEKWCWVVSIELLNLFINYLKFCVFVYFF